MMRQWNVYSLWSNFSITSLVLLFVFFVLTSCSSDLSGPIDLYVVQPAGPNTCTHVVDVGTLTTLLSLSEMRGELGQVVYFDQDIVKNSDSLDTFEGMDSLDVQFTSSGAPQDMDSLFAASVYWSIEQGYLQYKNLGIDLKSYVENLSDTRILYQAIWTKSVEDSDEREEKTDNAYYLPWDNVSPMHNFFIFLPLNILEWLPLGINLGVVIHEFGHLVWRHVFTQPRIRAGVELGDVTTEATLDSIEEGYSDVMGFLRTLNPEFILCSLPKSTYRDLSEKKSKDRVLGWLEKLKDGSLEAHRGGALFASIQYQIGQLIGHVANGRILANFLKDLTNCGRSGKEITANFETIRDCNAKVGGSHSSTIRQIYNDNFYGFSF